MRRIFMNALPLLAALIGMCTLGACPASADNQTYPNIPQNPNAAAMQATCTGYTALQFTATGLAASTSYTAVVTITAECPGSTTPTTHTVNVNFSTPATVTGLPGGPAFRNTDYIQVGNTNCVQVTINPNTYCEDNPGLPVNNPSVQNYSTGPDGGINGPLSLNPQDTSTNNGCAVTATITLTATPSSVAATVVNMEGNFAPNPQDVVCPCILSQIGPAGSFAILGLEDSRLQLSSGPLQVNGNVGIGAYGLFQFSGGAYLHGTLYYDPTASVQISGGSSFKNGQVSESFTAIDNAAAALAAIAEGLTPTQTFSQIQKNTTITGNGGQNVISVTGNFHLSGGQNLVISGGPKDTFYINVYQGLQLDGGANIALSGVPPSQVLFNFIGTQQLQTSGNANTAGIYLGTNPNQQVQINGGVHHSAFIFASNNFSFQSNPVVDQIACVQ